MTPAKSAPSSILSFISKNKKSPPLVTVVACHHKGDFIRQFVRSTIGSETDFPFEIFIITSDSELAMTGLPGCSVFFSEGLPAEKRNIAARLAGAPYLAFFDDDVELTEHCLRELLVKTAAAGAVMGYGKLLNMEHRDRLDDAGCYLTWTGFLWSRAGQLSKDVGQYNKPVPVLAGKSACCIIRKDVFNAIGGFDESFGILGEETDLSWRVWLYGGLVFYLPTAVAYHAFNTRFKPAREYYTDKRVYFNGCRNYLTMLIKNLSLKRLCLILPAHLVLWVIACFAMLLKGRFAASFWILRGLLYPLLRWKTVYKGRKLAQELRREPDSELFRVILKQPQLSYFLGRLRAYLRTGLHG